MCGITGIYSTEQNFSEDDLRKMNIAISHRGPDADGYFIEQPAYLAHKRLSIIDLSEEANQPMYSHSNDHVLVYNGEVYNYDDLRREQAIKVNTTSDTEVILQMLVSQGPDAIQWFNGMFAFAFYDRKEKSLLVARDRIGIKPLYYFWDGKVFAFASELKALKKLQHVRSKLRLNHKAINEFLHLGYIPQPHTIYENIHKLPAGSFIKLKGTKLEIEQYWEMNSFIKPEVYEDEMQAKEILRDLIEDSVRMRLKSDVEFGAFLSGGIDSSLVAAVAQRNLNSKLKTFSIGFDNAKHDESKYARKVANFLKTDHHEQRVTEKEAVRLVHDILDVYDEPYADSSAIPSMMVSKMARANVTMALSGDGGDELFMGYGAYRWAEKLSGGYQRNLRKPIAAACSVMNSRFKRAGKLFEFEDNSTIKSHIFSQEQYFYSRKEIRSMVSKEYYNDIVLNEDYSGYNRELEPAEQQAMFDLHYYLKEDLLTKVDRASMHYALEARVPLLDHNIVEFALNVSPRLKIKNGVQKHLLKEVLYDYIPAEFFQRPKWGFSIPLHQWLQTDLQFLIQDYLSPEVIKEVGIVDYNTVRKMTNAFLHRGHEYLYNRLWLLIILHKFIKDKMQE